ncbi:MAG: hypothetical protein IT353_06205 [Gemmatimonadaceae bacterium]|nr:hypothetical protein [Gemmatimonadaceae bacterium]
MLHSVLFVASLLCALPMRVLCAQRSAPPLRSSDSAPLSVEQQLAGGRLRVINLARVQHAILRTRGTQSDSAIVERLVRDVYRPYTEFWSGYLGDESRFRRLAQRVLVDHDTTVLARIAALETLSIDSMFEASSRWVMQHTSLAPEGTWVLVFGHGATDMGSVGAYMVADLNALESTRASWSRLLPHELTHMVYGKNAERRADSLRGTVLDRIISEGVATYASYVESGGRLSEADALLDSTIDWSKASALEGAMIDAVQPLLRSRDQAALDSVFSRRKVLIADGPFAAGYFLGFRLTMAYVAINGPGSWKDLLTLPLSVIVARARYPLVRPEQELRPFR